MAVMGSKRHSTTRLDNLVELPEVAMNQDDGDYNAPLLSRVLPLLSPIKSKPVPGGYLAQFLTEQAKKSVVPSPTKAAKNARASPPKPRVSPTSTSSPKHTSSTKATLSSPPPDPPPRKHKRRESANHMPMRTYAVHELERIAAKLNVKDAKQMLVCFDQRHKLSSDVDAMHAKIAAYRQAGEKERARQVLLRGQIESAQAMLPQCQDQKATREAQRRVLDDAIASTTAELTQLKKTLAATDADAKAMAATLHTTTTSLHRHAALAQELRDVRRQSAAAAERLRQTKDALLDAETQCAAALAEMAQQTTDVATVRAIVRSSTRNILTCTCVAAAGGRM
ncbi:Aste57867_14374 [Aphanomyces stellatus]|uniref:Aste57867_14374 protein n=1 Tax=Aphanomyces stellatus TaxID=120398 RepID=A0A485L2Y2_9STRA|nr:hypothetical protein As57867_014320 [Aphanomyces stellatus]VFT91197.1 Aste57867_14374 [Aphanomyces stellatus]